MKSLIFAFLLIVMVLAGCKKPAKKSTEIVQNNLKKEITGRIYMVGNEPFARLALTVNDSVSYFLSSNDSLMNEMKINQGNEVTIILDSLNTNLEGTILFFTKYKKKKE